ncbi:uncharacterized protein BDR25DRAFT_356833 [Lindgomyces ingoldianus]|uniref:Uncharacterized protein n=1 Tax=Lindgomyces ingoldianus TaxID=673940 RepID=A0ACB6QPW7_9PLEO|nr:uncharacterized protein BDR25DRAFT_356833 [Lindgomyces ingoldianus]KAF2469069.1 hypothetical protein BDR25DRAFT_356833 [Lindgomyces ingoldianus]
MLQQIAARCKLPSNTSRAEKGSINQDNQSRSHTSYPNPSFISGSPETVFQSDNPLHSSVLCQNMDTFSIYFCREFENAHALIRFVYAEILDHDSMMTSFSVADAVNKREGKDSTSLKLPYSRLHFIPSHNPALFRPSSTPTNKVNTRDTTLRILAFMFCLWIWRLIPFRGSFSPAQRVHFHHRHSIDIKRSSIGGNGENYGEDNVVGDGRCSVSIRK